MLCLDDPICWSRLILASCLPCLPLQSGSRILLGVCFSNKCKPTNPEHILQLTSLVGLSFSGPLYYSLPSHPSTRQSPLKLFKPANPKPVVYPVLPVHSSENHNEHFAHSYPYLNTTNLAFVLCGP